MGIFHDNLRAPGPHYFKYSGMHELIPLHTIVNGPAFGDMESKGWCSS